MATYPAGAPPVPPAGRMLQPPSVLTLTPGPNNSWIPNISEHER